MSPCKIRCLYASVKLSREVFICKCQRINWWERWHSALTRARLENVSLFFAMVFNRYFFLCGWPYFQLLREPFLHGP